MIVINICYPEGTGVQCAAWYVHGHDVVDHRIID